MPIITRRDTLAIGAGALAATTFAREGRAAIGLPNIQPPKMPAENGATLRVLRPTKFLDPDQVVWNKNTAEFTKQTGIQVRVDYVGWEDLRPQTAVAARTGAGPDIVVGWPEDPHLYSDKLLDVSELADYLGRKYGGWYFLAEKYGIRHGTKTWTSIPMGGSGGPCVYRKSWVKEAGFDSIPTDMGKFLELCQNLQKIGHPVGFALGNAVGDANSYTQWMLWAHGGKLVDEEGRVAIDSKETIEALRYCKAMYPTMIGGTMGWGDPSNNKAFISGDISLTSNGVSIYFALKNDPKLAEAAADTDHAFMPFGPVGRNPQSALILNAMVFKHSKYPNAAQQYLRFLMEEEQYEPWLTGCIGYWSQPLKAYANAAVWTSDPKLKVYRETCDNRFWNGYSGPINAAAGASSADYVIVHMFAAVASGSATPEDAAKQAAAQAQRFYKT